MRGLGLHANKSSQAYASFTVRLQVYLEINIMAVISNATALLVSTGFLDYLQASHQKPAKMKSQLDKGKRP